MDVDFDPGKRIELWICDDCMLIKETDECHDFESSRREREVRESLFALEQQGHFGNDCTDEDQRECTDCYHIGSREDFPFTAATDDEDSYRSCPKCNSAETRDREDGYDEFSWRDCDCCGSSLGGSRTRYCLFPWIKEEQCQQP